MKIFSIGDIHGRIFWEPILKSIENNLLSGDKCIFIGDYMDSFIFSSIECFLNLKKIVEWKEKYPDNIILLLGNHDLNYYFFHDSNLFFKLPQFGTTKDLNLLKEINLFFQEKKDYFDICFQYKNYLYSHAGISKSFYLKYLRGLKISEIGEKLKDDFRIKDLYLFNRSGARGGHAAVAGPFWADISETFDDQISGLNQIIGHSEVSKIFSKKKENSTHYYIDIIHPNNLTYLTLDFEKVEI